MKHLTTSMLVAGCLTAFTHVSVATADDGMFIIRDTTDSPAELAARIRQYAEGHDDWLFLSEHPLKGGEVTIMKICYPPIGPDFFQADMKASAMLPCGNLAIYEEGDITRMSLLHPRFMNELYPDPNLERAGDKALPAFEAMLDTVFD
ncbi:DUF302 domain-containing protein [Thioalkalivibrio paradoxus]|nr:DUF302 domain-containing protein [Thioalkalivibrio paradoxus]